MSIANTLSLAIALKQYDSRRLFCLI